MRGSPTNKLPKSADTWSLDYKAAKTAVKFHKSKGFVRGLLGPVGSGKSVACCVEMFVRASKQHPSTDGKRRTRFIVIRNTTPELETTTIKTWLDWFPEKVFGRMNRKPPYRHLVQIGDIEMEVIFLALDRPEDVKKLKSLEATGIWINEAKHVLEEVILEATSRVGRYPSKKEKPASVPDSQWPTWWGVIMDTNPPDTDHWWYACAEENKWARDADGDALDIKKIPVQDRWDFFQQPSGLSKDADNIENLPEGYYRRQITGKTKEWVNSYVHGNYAFIQDGKAVYGSAYNDDIHSFKDLEKVPGCTVYVGLDFGLTPCAVFGQKNAIGQWLILEEFITLEGSTIGLPQFAQLLKAHINTHYSEHPIFFYGDPSGGFRDQQGKTAFDLFRQHNLIVRPAPTNSIEPRREGVLQPLLRMVDGKVGFMLSTACGALRKGFNGGYKFKRMNVSGEAKYSLIPDKNRFSHPHDALQYLLCGAGEYRDLVTKSGRSQKTVFSRDWSAWG